jgi:uncharacterized membrane protein HdeD (DUF308 family)
VALSGVVLVLGITQVVRAASAGAGPVAWLIGVALVVAGGGRLFLWWRQRGR